MGKHITLEQRYEIQALRNTGHNLTQIAKAIGKDKSTVGREVGRNKLSNGSYKALNAQFFHEQSRKPCHRNRKLSDPVLLGFVKAQLEQDKSPEQISGIMKVNKMEQQVSHECIYQYVWDDKIGGGHLHEHLRNRGRRYRKRGAQKDNRGIIRDRVSIEKRPDIVERRDRVGDLEIDLVVGKNHSSPLLTVVERKSGMAWVRKLGDKSAASVEEKLMEILLPINNYVYTITSDNGKEFAYHKSIAEKLGADFFFARPYHSWERGCNENYNRLLRQYFPKKTDFTDITDAQILQVQERLNNRERKRLGFISPFQYLQKLLINNVAFKT